LKSVKTSKKRENLKKLPLRNFFSAKHHPFRALLAPDVWYVQSFDMREGYHVTAEEKQLMISCVVKSGFLARVFEFVTVNR
jgi:hypothetical protein